jgi:hypothetical protein
MTIQNNLEGWDKPSLIAEKVNEICQHFFDLGAREGIVDFKFVRDIILDLRKHDMEELIKRICHREVFEDKINKQDIKNYYNK